MITELFFTPEVVAEYKYKTTRDKYNFVKGLIKYKDQDEFTENLDKFLELVDKQEETELWDMVDNWDKAELVLKYRRALRTISVLEQEVEMIKETK
jgi:hypothetical protein